MSKILEELCNATETTKKRGEEVKAFYERLLTAVGKLADAEWDKLSKAAQDWNNSGSDALEAKQAIPEPPDLQTAEPQKEEPTRRGRRGVEAEKEEAKAAYEPGVGDEVTVTTSGRRAKTSTGIVVELVGGEIVINPEGDKGEAKFDEVFKIAAVTIAPVAEEEQEAEETPEEADPKEGDTVTLIIEGRRGDKTVTGICKVADDEGFVLEIDGKEEDFPADKVKNVKVHVPATAVPSGRRGRGAATTAAEPEKAAEPAKRTRSSNGEVSLGTRIKEIVAGNTKLSEEAVGKVLDKEDMKYAPATLTMVYKETHKFLELLKKLNLLK